MCPVLGLNLHVSGITRDGSVFMLINSAYSCFCALIAYLGSLLILYYEVTFSNFEVLNVYLKFAGPSAYVPHTHKCR